MLIEQEFDWIFLLGTQDSRLKDFSVKNEYIYIYIYIYIYMYIK